MISSRHELLDIHLPLHDRLVAQLPPTADITPQVIYVKRNGGHAVMVLPGYDGGSLDEFLPTVVQELRNDGATVVLLARYGWILKNDLAQEALCDGIRPRDHPKREEVCVVIAADSDGVTYAQAPVIRSGKIQMLGVWERSDDVDLTKTSGREVTALLEGVSA